MEADSLFEAVVYAIARFREDPWMEVIASGTLLDVEVQEPGSKHTLTLTQVERWISGGVGTPAEQVKKAKLKTLLVRGS